MALYISICLLYTSGIICNDLRQYVLLGDAAAMTDGKIGNEDDRWIFTAVSYTHLDVYKRQELSGIEPYLWIEADTLFRPTI